MSENKITTFTGRAIDPLDPDPSEVCIEDIAHGLALTNRFSGHTTVPYSVAQHCLLVSEHLNIPNFIALPVGCSRSGLALDGLLHDAAEAYLTDIPRPFKSRIPGYKEIEDRLLKAIYIGLGIVFPTKSVQEIVKRADGYALEKEQANLMPHNIQAEFPKKPFLVLDWEQAEKRYLELYEELLNEVSDAPLQINNEGSESTSVREQERTIWPSTGGVRNRIETLEFHFGDSNNAISSSHVYAIDESLKSIPRC